MDFHALLKKARQNQEHLEALDTSIFSRPATALTLGMKAIVLSLRDLVVQFVSNQVLLAATVCVTVLYAALHFYEPTQPLVFQANAWIQDGIFWVVLGILSSVGFGTGMHSGILFLFPHVFRVCLAADQCASMDFYTNAFYKGGPASALAILPIGDTPDYCSCPPSTDGQVPGLIARVLRVSWPCFLWGAGTAIGEIPPYLMALKARASGEAERMMEDEVMPGSFEAMQRWMIEKVREYGFWGVFFFAAYPNAFFDLCGLCCGMISMNFWTFFSAVLLGKAVVKVQGQAVFFCMIFSKTTVVIVEDLVKQILLFVGMPGEAEKFASKLQSQIKQFHPGAELETKERTTTQIVIQLFIMGFILYFLAKALEQFAKDQYSVECKKHFEEIEKRWETEKEAKADPTLTLEYQKELEEWVRPWERRNGAELGVLIQLVIVYLYIANDKYVASISQTSILWLPAFRWALVTLPVVWLPLGHQVETAIIVMLFAELMGSQYYPGLPDDTNTTL